MNMAPKSVPAKATKAKASVPVPAKAAPKTSERALTAPQSLAAKIAATSGAGMEGTDRDSFAIPFIRVLQSTSPQCTPGKTGYIKGARPGQLFNTVTGELTDGETGILFVPCAFQRRFIQWAPRGDKGGYKGEFLPEDIKARQDSGEIITGEDSKLYVGPGTNPKKNDRVVDTRNHFGLVLGATGVPAQALLSLTSTQIKKSKQLMGILSALVVNGKTPPTWLSKIRITTVDEQNDQGAWKGIRVEHAGFIEDEKTFDAGAAFHQVISAGKARVNYDEAAESAPDDDGGEPERF
jgi:hypothetical protein